MKAEYAHRRIIPIIKFSSVVTQILSLLCMQLNSWDSRIIDEPDYDMRLEGFSEAKQLLLTACQQGEGPVQWTAGLVDMVTPHCHTCLFYLLQVRWKGFAR